MKLSDFKVTQCVGCGTTNPPLLTIPTLNAAGRGCPACVAKYGAAVLGRVADEALAGARSDGDGPGHCLHCGEAVLVAPDGRVPIMCAACIAEWRALG